MGREIKRVPLDFDWPMDIVWKGYMNPYRSTDCKLCDGSGQNSATKKLSDDWYAHLRTDGKEGWMYHLEQADIKALLDKGRLRDFNDCIPTPDEVNAWARNGIGHDSINHWICVEAKAKRLGIYGECSHCKGKGYYYCEDKYEELSEEWESIEPPTGEGYQLWETTSEGSPRSPVFKTPEELAKWLFDNKASSFGTQTCTYEQWLNFIRGPGWAPSAISHGNVLCSGVEYVSKDSG
jgi:hypothetical protein